MTRLSVKPLKRENQRPNLYKKKREKRNTYNEPHQQTITTEKQIPDVVLVETNAAGLNVQIGTNLHHPCLKQ